MSAVNPGELDLDGKKKLSRLVMLTGVSSDKLSGSGKLRLKKKSLHNGKVKEVEIVSSAYL